MDGLKIDVKQVNQQTVSQTIDAMVKADPQLVCFKKPEKRGDVDWRQVKEIHHSFKYDNSGLGVGAELVTLVTYVTWGAGSTLVGVAANIAVGCGQLRSRSSSHESGHSVHFGYTQTIID